MIFEGTQPTLTHVPPVVPLSTSVTLAPPSEARSAAAIAAPPLPMTATRNGAPRSSFLDGPSGVSPRHLCGRPPAWALFSSATP